MPRKEPVGIKMPRFISSMGDMIAQDRTVCAEIKGRSEICVRGCRKILVYSPVKISLKLKDGTINICGNGLTCFAFSETDMSIRGKIKCVFFSEESMGRCKI